MDTVLSIFLRVTNLKMVTMRTIKYKASFAIRNFFSALSTLNTSVTSIRCSLFTYLNHWNETTHNKEHTTRSKDKSYMEIQNNIKWLSNSSFHYCNFLSNLHLIKLNQQHWFRCVVGKYFNLKGTLSWCIIHSFYLTQTVNKVNNLIALFGTCTVVPRFYNY